MQYKKLLQNINQTGGVVSLCGAEKLMRYMMNDQQARNLASLGREYMGQATAQPIRQYAATQVMFGRPLGIAYVDALSRSTTSYLVEAKLYQSQISMTQPPITNKVTNTFDTQREKLFAEAGRLRESMYRRELIYS